MDKLFKLFDALGLPYFRQGSLSDEDYAPSFFTFWNIDTPSLKHRDNKEKEFEYYCQIGFYTNNASLIYSQLDEGGAFRQAAINAGFTISRANDANADKKDYFGRVCYIRIKIKVEE